MFGLFNVVNPFKQKVQLLNLAAMTWYTYDWMTNPQANTAHFTFEMAAHIITILSLKDNEKGFTNKDFLAVLANVAQLGANLNQATSSCTESSLLTSIIGMGINVFNLGSSVFSVEDTPDEQARMQITGAKS